MRTILLIVLLAFTAGCSSIPEVSLTPTPPLALQSPTATQPISGQIPPLHIKGNHVVGPNGTAVQLQGATFSGLEYRCSLGGRYTANNFAAFTKWHMNAIKIPVNPHYWVGDDGCQAAAYQQAVIDAIETALAGKFYVLLAGYAVNHHASGDPMPDLRTVTTFTALLQRYGADGRVLYEPYTEPHNVTLATWRDGDATQGYVGFQSLFDTLRQVSPTALLFANGPDWGGKPGVIVAGGYGLHCTQCGYSAHIYDQNSAADPANWADNFGTLAQSVPVLAGEFGDTTHHCDPAWLNRLLPYLRTNLDGWFAWAWDVGTSCSRPDLLSSWDGTPSIYGAPIQAFFAQGQG